MKIITQKEFKKIIDHRDSFDQLILREYNFKHMDLTGWDLSNIDFTLSSFQDVKLDKVNFQNSIVENVLFDGCPLHGANFKNANMKTASFRYCDMIKCNIEGADLYGAVLEYAKLDGIHSNENTKWFRLRCPEIGAFLGYKKCINDCMVQLLIPSDAKRSSATLPSCRCNKAKVLTIKSFDFKENYEEAWSLVDENFIYRKGEWVEVKNFNEDRWMDSTTGIHFWMSREEAQSY
ncbi:pentapeptide repeat-containing protein [Terrisporobacter glycolicus]|uniref:Pentapeptide repeat protein n=1 Tax=Terrisporobacter glycolicus ATCC 14880 = DSM 1288 TaxID=1121315 RepID=A0ABZ2EVU5_9FIRM|nr:pentapeptide repeat-containing protein [Terrisporobacter glycolicus]